MTRAGRVLGFAWTNLMMAQFAVEDATTAGDVERAKHHYGLAQLRYDEAEKKLAEAVAAKVDEK